MLTAIELADAVLGMLWGLLRVGGMVMMAPLLGAIYIPNRIRILLSVVLAFALLPTAGPPPAIEPLSGAGVLAIARELAIGITIGFVLKLATEAALLAGQLVSTGMGLSFATVVDPQNGGMPLLGRFYVIIASLLLLATNAHLALIAVLAQSYAVAPVGAVSLAAPDARLVVEFAGLMFAGALQLSLPAMVAILMVNVAFGVMSRAAPTLNLFAVGFPITILMGLVILVVTLRTQAPVWDGLIGQAFGLLGRLFGGV